MTTNPLIALFASEPALVEPSQVDRFEACLESAATHPRFGELMAGPGGDDFWSEDRSWARPYVVQKGILQIPVRGVLLNGFPYAFGNYATGYEYVQKAFERGMADSNVKAIALVIDSPGGMVAGNFDLVDKMYAAKGGKPVRAFAAESAYSAAYSIASVADHISVSRTGGVGSIGVVTSHTDMSGALEQRGIKITFIHAGKYKVEGNPTEALSTDAKARIQARIDELYGVFVSTVARNRGMEEKAVRDTEALTFTATQAVSNGLADSIGSLEDAMSAFAGFLDDQSDNNGDDEMADQATQSAVDQAALDSALAQGKTEGATAERARINAILGSDEGKARPKAALSAALKTDMSVEQATAFLGDLAEEKAEAPVAVAPEKAVTTFDEAMKKDNPEVGASGSDGEKSEKSEDDATDLVALAQRVGLKGFTAPAAK